MLNNDNWADTMPYGTSSPRQPSFGAPMHDFAATDQMQNNFAATGQMRTDQGPPPVMDRYYIPGYLTSIIGANVRAEFMIGTTQYMDKTGTLREVGVNYFVLEDFISHARIMCDLYSVKFVTSL